MKINQIISYFNHCFRCTKIKNNKQKQKNYPRFTMFKIPIWLLAVNKQSSCLAPTWHSAYAFTRIFSEHYTELFVIVCAISKMRKLSLEFLSNGSKYRTGKSKTEFCPVLSRVLSDSTLKPSLVPLKVKEQTQKERGSESCSPLMKNKSLCELQMCDSLLIYIEPWLRPSDIEIQLKEIYLRAGAQAEDCSVDGKLSSFLLET